MIHKYGGKRGLSILLNRTEGKGVVAVPESYYCKLII